MNTKAIIIGTLVVLGLAGLMWRGQGNPATAPSSVVNGEKMGSLLATETPYDFGTISMAAGKVDKIFKVTNPTSQDVILVSVTTSCMCTTVYIVSAGREKGPFGMPGHAGLAARANEIVKAGESVDIKVVYDPAAHGPAGVGPVDRFIYLAESNGGVTRLEIKAMVTP